MRRENKQNPIIDQSLFNTVWYGGVEEVLHKIQREKISPNAIESGDQRRSALIAGVLQLKTDVIQALLDNGADPDLDDYLERSPLMYIARENDRNRNEQKMLEIANFLIIHGADIHKTDKSGDPALFYAIKARNFAIAALLVARGASIDCTDRSGNSPLMLACKTENSLALIKELLKHNVDLTVTDINGNTALQIGASQPFGKPIVDLLLTAGANKDDLFKNGDTELMYALLWADTLNIDQYLLEKTINSQNKKGETALMIAVKRNNIVAVNQLITAGAEINTKNTEGKTALFYAHNEQVCRILIAAGADVNIIPNDKVTFLIFALRQYHWGTTLVSELLTQAQFKKEALNALPDVGLWGRNDKTALFIAAEMECSGNKEYGTIVRLLLEAGALPTIKGDSLFSVCSKEVRLLLDSFVNKAFLVQETNLVKASGSLMAFWQPVTNEKILNRDDNVFPTIQHEI